METLEGVTRTQYNQYESVILPLKSYLDSFGVDFSINATVKDLDFKPGEEITVTAIHIEDEEGEKVFSKSTVQYLFFFTDINGETIKKLKSSNITEDDKTELVLYLNKLSYPYIKEHIESKYKKANIEVKLPFELDDK